MSEHTEVVSGEITAEGEVLTGEVEAPQESAELVHVRQAAVAEAEKWVGKGLTADQAETLSSLTPEHAEELLSDLSKGGSAEKFFAELGSLDMALKSVSDKVAEARTKTGAYAVHAGVKLGKTATQIGSQLGGVSTSRVSQLRQAERLHFGLGFSCESEVFRYFTNRSREGFAALLANKAGLSDETLRDRIVGLWIAQVHPEQIESSSEPEAVEPNREVGGSAASTDESGAGAETTSRTSPNEQPNPVAVEWGTEKPRSNPARLDKLEVLVADLETLSPGEWARLNSLLVGIEGLLNGSRNREAGQRIYAREFLSQDQAWSEAQAAAAAE